MSKKTLTSAAPLNRSDVVSAEQTTKNKGTPMANEVKSEAKTERETFTYKQRELNRAAKYVAAMHRLHDAAEAKGLAQSALDLIEAASSAVETLSTKLLAKMPEDFAPVVSTRQSATFEAGDVISPSEEAKILYTKLDNECTVKEVIRFGGREDGKGAKIFLKVKRSDGSSNTVPAAHFVSAE